MPVWSTLADSHHWICPRQSQSWKHHDVWFQGLCGQMPWSTMEASHYGRQYTGHTALYVLQLHVISLVDGGVSGYNYTFIWLCAVSYSCCIRCYRRLFTVPPGWYFRWLHSQRRGELSGICVVVESQWVAYRMKRPSFCSICFHSHPAAVFVEPWYAAVEVKRWW